MRLMPWASTEMQGLGLALDLRRVARRLDFLVVRFLEAGFLVVRLGVLRALLRPRFWTRLRRVV